MDYDEEYCKRTFCEYEPLIRSLCNCKLDGSQKDIDAVVSQIFYDYCEAVEQGKSIASIKAWLLSKAIHLIKINNSKNESFLNSNDPITNFMYEVKNIDFYYRDNMADTIINDNNFIFLREEIEKELTPNELLLLEFIYKDNLKYKDIANILNTSISAVKQRIYRLKRKIKKSAEEKLKNKRQGLING